jgi:hypothetical protein
MKKIKWIFAFLGFSLVMQSQLKSYSFYRGLKPVEKAGFYEIKIGSSIIDRDGFYRVYQIGTNDTVEVAHVKEDQVFYSYDSHYFKQVKIIDESFEKDKCSFATLVLDTDMIYNSAYLNLTGNDFFKDVSVEGSDNNKSWKTITEKEKLFNYNKGTDEHYFRNKIEFKDITFKYLRLKFDDSRSLKVRLEAAFIPIDKQYNVTTGELVPCTIVRTEDPKTKKSIIECALSRKYLVTILNFKVVHTSPHFKRNYTIHLLDNSHKKDNWVYYGEGTLLSEGDNSIVINNYSSDGTFKTDKIRLIVDNLDDVPLKEVGVEVYTHEQKIKLKLEPAKKYVLAYGKENDSSPQYDIENFKNAIPAILPLVELGTEVVIPHTPEVKPEPLVSNTKWIWVALVGCIVLIALFTAKLLKPGAGG